MDKIKHTIKDFLPALSSRNFRLYVAGQGISFIGSWLAIVAEQWLIYPTLTNDKSLLGLVGAVNLIPTAALVLFAGVISDHINKKNLLLLTQFIYMLISFVVAFLVFSHQIQVWHIFVAAFIFGIVFAFELPSRNTLMLSLVEKKHYSSALSLQSGMFNSARAIGPALAGFMIALIGIAPAYFLNGLSFLAVVISVLAIQLPPHITEKKEGSMKEGFKQGIQFIHERRFDQLLLVLIGLQALLVWPVNGTFPIYAHDIFKRGEIGFGFLQSTFGIGAIIGAFGFTKLFNKFSNKSLLLKISTATIGISLLIFAYMPIFYGALIILAVLGLATSIFFSATNTFLQTSAPDDLRGRITSISSFVLFGFMPVGSIIMSFSLKYVSVQNILIAVGIIYLICSFIVVSSKDLSNMHIDKHHD